MSARLRDLVTVALAMSAGVHAALAPEHWRERPLLGIGFVAAAATLGVAVVWLQTAPSRLAAALAAAVLAGLSVLYLVSRTRGLPVTGREEWDAVGVATQALQVVGIAIAAALVRGGNRSTATLATGGGAHARPRHA
jgi:hypothetical protein